MHYIIGTSFKINQGKRVATLRYNKGLVPNMPYILQHISMKENGSKEYLFVGADRKTCKVEFANCREADKFIAMCRNERLPDYDNQEGSDNL